MVSGHSTPPIASTTRGQPLLFGALGGTFYLEHLRPEHEPQLERAMECVAEWFGARLHWTHLWCAGFEPFQRSHLDYVSGLAGNLTISDTHPSLPADARRMARELTKKLRGGVAIRTGGGEEIEAASPFSCCFRACFRDNDNVEDPVIACRAVLHLAVEEQWPIDDFRRRMREIASLLPVQWGTAGYTYAWWDYQDITATRNAIFPHARRHWGYDIGQAIAAFDPFYERLHTVNWLTFLGTDLAAGASLPDNLPQPISSENLASCLLLQAGEAPGRGDVNRFDTLPAYQRLDALLRSLRWTTAGEFAVFGRGWTKQTLEEWLNRFERTRW